ncbi:Hypothetical protein I5071_62960 [Sandaracinus amylolyticus]|nr:Hypothetical protein I5071_62960 [Sandaracinus amylolyticus]
MLALVLSASCIGETTAACFARLPTLAWCSSASITIVLGSGLVIARWREVPALVLGAPLVTLELLAYWHLPRGIGLGVMVVAIDVVLSYEPIRWLLGPCAIVLVLAREAKRDQGATIEHWLRRLAGKSLGLRDELAVWTRLALFVAIVACVSRASGPSVVARVWIAACGLFAIVLGLWCVGRVVAIGRARVVVGDDARAPRLLPGARGALVIAGEDGPYRDRVVLGAVPFASRRIALQIAIASGAAALLGALAMLV